MTTFVAPLHPGALAVALSLAIGLVAAAIILLSLVISVLYSLPPVALSYRILLAPPTLAVAYYVGIPYWAGGVAVGGACGYSPCSWWGLYLLFAGRIALRDSRYREGDAAHGKPSFLLRHGKRATCPVSIEVVCACDVRLIATLAKRR